MAGMGANISVMPNIGLCRPINFFPNLGENDFVCHALFDSETNVAWVLEYQAKLLSSVLRPPELIVQKITDVTEAKYPKDPNDSKDPKDLKDLRNLKDLKNLRNLKDLRNFRS